MTKLIFCLHRLPELSALQFQDYWKHQHAPLVRELAPILKIRRYIQTYPFFDEKLYTASKVRGGAAGYDGVAELYWESIDDLRSTATDLDAIKAGRRLLEDERKFIDLPRSPLLFADEVVVVGSDAAESL
ncbi:MAG: ethyl tert-butyl ether degradation protein EthD [Hydrocarboniphaga sp.]|uniref:EthD domain-containing protein n=1 Tax=Hydrocarboniphaga sp. TaxID=2033016 RepID=UPI002624707A|nr:EthD domain-containing protein [Hydrocarboniphaga sp.]MDB5967865.1 ethyl tert-butyl ether degradation protein EthD [Hydrocarboniphaga sp.]